MYKIITIVTDSNKLILCLLFTLLSILSCSTDSNFSIDQTYGEAMEVTFSLNFSSISTSGEVTSKNSSDLIENSALRIIVFEKQADDYYFLDFGTLTEINNSNTETLYKVKFDAGTNPVHLMILANAEEIANYETWTTGVTTKEEICSSLIYDLSEKEGWSDDESSIPLWGESPDFFASQSNKTLNRIPLLRMFSAIQVVLDERITEDNFKLKEVILYNAHTKGTLIPHKENWDKQNQKITAASLPEQPLIEDITLGKDIEGNFMETIYICESWPTETPNRDNVPFLLIGGNYEGEQEVTWYRIDFLEENENKEKSYRPLLRNRLNRILISGIGNRGDEDKEEAKKKEKADMDVTISEWDLIDANLLLYGYNVLSVSRNNIILPKESNDQVQVTVYTDYYDGWTAEVSAGYKDWLHIIDPDPAIGQANVYTSLTFAVSENDTDISRTGEIHIYVGSRIDYTLYITQEENELTLSVKNKNVEVHELVFSSNMYNLDVAAQDLIVDWNPSEEVCLVAVTEGANPFIFHTSSDKPGEDALTGGNTTLSIRPVPFTAQEVADNPFIERTTTLDFIVSTNSTFKKHTVILRHINYHLEIAKLAPSYRIGKTYEIDIITNTDDWTVKTLDLQGVFKKDVVANLDRNTVTVEMTDNPLRADWEGGFFVYSEKAGISGSRYCYASMRLFKVFPSSFIVKPGGSCDIYISPIQTFWREWLGNPIIEERNNSSETFTFEVIWQSSPSIMVALAPASLTLEWSGNSANSKDYRNGKFTLFTNPAIEGNVLIGAYNKGKLVWSWHIWVTDYDPETENVSYTHSGTNKTVFMDRNLGAMTNTANNVNSIGFYYQWGRKDPFPGPTSYSQGNTSSSSMALYNKSGTKLAVPSTSSPTSIPMENLKSSVENPYTFIVQGNSVNDWYSPNEGQHNDYLWIDEEGYKNIFDPCPEGWRVPHFKNGRTPWFNISLVNPSNNAYNWTNEVGSFVTSGFRRGEDGLFNSLSFLHTWMADPAGNLAYGFRAANGVNGTNTYNRAVGLVIRCVKDEDN